MKNRFIIASLLGFLAVVFGAFAAHALKAKLTESQLGSFEVGVKYQLIHVLYILIVLNFSFFSESIRKKITAIALLGIFLFSGSIYLLSMGWVQAKYLWFVTPVGGLFFLISWGMLFVEFIKTKKMNF